MLVFHSHCQMGNQMFIYACARSLAKRRKLPYCLSELNHLRYFRLAPEDNTNRLRYMLFRFRNFLSPSGYTKHHLQDNRIDYAAILLNETSKNCWYYGYFQGLNYFFDNENDIRQCFQIQSGFKTKFQYIFPTLPIGGRKLVAVHFRRRDYKTFGPDYLNGPDLTLPFSYYHRVINQINANDVFFIFLSDDMKGIKEEFGHIENAWFSDNDSITDLQFLIAADICVISNSTFGWWGAWLNDKPDKKIYVPEYFLGFKVKQEFPVNIIPEGWIRVINYEL